jgi:hypothetical protein
MDPDPDPGGPKTRGSGSATVLFRLPVHFKPPWFHYEPPKLQAFDFDADPKRALHFDADPDPSSQNYSKLCGSGLND